MTTRVRIRSALVAGLLVATTFSACNPMGSFDSVRPAAVAADQWRMSAMFDDALNLPLGAPVKLGGVVVGKVVAIDPESYKAKVSMAIDDEVELPSDSQFRLRYTTGLGEVFVEVSPGRRQPLREGASVDTTVTSAAPTVEDSLASASMLVNGGSLGQIQTIVHELNTVLTGRVDATKGMLNETDRFLGQVLQSTKQVDRVLTSLRGASTTLNKREQTINRALREIRPAARALDESTADLAKLLRRTDRMAVTADRLVKRTRDDLTLVMNQLGPVLEELVAIAGRLIPGLDIVSAFARRMDAASPTDYLNLKFRLKVDNPSLNDDQGDLLDGVDLPLGDLLDPLKNPWLPTDKLPRPPSTGGGGLPGLGGLTSGLGALTGSKR